MAENPPLNRIYVLGYSANDRDYPIVSLNADPRVAGYRVPEDLSACPDKRYPNHVFTGAQPISGDERVRHVWEILPSPWVPFTRYDDDLGPVQGRRRSVKNEGQVASREADKQVTYEAREGSAIVYTELEETWSIKTDEDGNSLFPIRDRDFYDPSRGPVQERRQLFVPTGEEMGSLENVGGVITQTSYEPYNEFLSVKIVQTYKVDGPQLIGNATDNEGQLVTITTQRKGALDYVPPSPTATRTIEVSREDAESVVERIVDTPEIFSGKLLAKEATDPAPAKFRVAVPTITTEETVGGQAVEPVLGEGEISKSQQQVTKFVKRLRSTFRNLLSLPKTLTQKTTNNEGQVVAVKETLQYGDTEETPTATKTVESEALGDGTYLVRTTEAPEVFESKRIQATRENLTPAKFRIFSPETSEERVIEGQVSDVFLDKTNVSKSEQQVTKFVKRVATVDKQSPVGISKITITKNGSAYTSVPTVKITPINGGAGAQAVAKLSSGTTGSVVDVEIISRGYGYDNGAIVEFVDAESDDGAEAIAEVDSPSIVESFLTQSGYPASRTLKLVKKEENKKYFNPENPFLVDASLDQTQEDEYALTQSFVTPIESLPAFSVSAPDLIPAKFKAKITERTFTSEVSGIIEKKKIDTFRGLLEATEQQISYNKKRTTGRVVGKYTGAITKIIPSEQGQNYSDQTEVKIFSTDGTGAGALVEPVIIGGKIVDYKVRSGGFGFFTDNIQYEIIDHGGDGYGATIGSIEFDRPLDPSEKNPDVILQQKITTTEKQLAEVTEILRDDDIGDLIDQEGNPIAEEPDALTDIRSENLGGKYVITKTVVPKVFEASVLSAERLDMVPAKFRAKIPTKTKQSNSEGIANQPSLGSEESDILSRTEQQINEFVKRVITVRREFEGFSSINGSKVYTPELGGGIADIEETFSSSQQSINPQLGTISSEVENIGNDFFVKREIKLQTPLPTLKGQTYDDTLDVTIPYTRQFIAAGTEEVGQPSSIDPRDTLHSIATRIDYLNARTRLLEVLYKTATIESVSLPDRLVSASLRVNHDSSGENSTGSGKSGSASVSVSVSTDAALVYQIEDGYSGFVDGESYLFFLPKEECTISNVLGKIGGGVEKWPLVRPKSHRVYVSIKSERKGGGVTLSLPSNTSISRSASVSTSIKSLALPPTLHGQINLSPIVVGESTKSATATVSGGNRSGTASETATGAASVISTSDISPTSPESFPTGKFLYRLETTPYKFGLVRINAIVVEIKDSMV